MYAMSVRHVRKMCKEIVRATRSVCTPSRRTHCSCHYMCETLSLTLRFDQCMYFDLSHQDLFHQCAFHQLSDVRVNSSRFPEACLLLILDDASVSNLNLSVGSPRSTISNGVRAILAILLRVQIIATFVSS